MRTTFGYTVKESNDKFVLAAEESIRISALQDQPGRWLVNSFPACERIIQADVAQLTIL
jgi:hypothetical protein